MHLSVVQLSHLLSKAVQLKQVPSLFKWNPCLHSEQVVDDPLQTLHPFRRLSQEEHLLNSWSKNCSSEPHLLHLYIPGSVELFIGLETTETPRAI